METQVSRTNGNGALQKEQLSPQQSFGRLISQMAEKELTALFGSETGKQAAARVGLAFRAASSTAKEPSAFYGCSPESVAACMATSAFTGIMPGGPFTGCYLIPKKVNNVQTLNWWINHRGIKTLARRANQAVETIPYFEGDTVTILRGREYGIDIQEGDADRDDPSRLDGVVVIVRALDTGLVMAVRKVTKSQISARRAKSDGVDKGTGEAKSGPWRDWPIEMAEKTAIKFAAGRGDIFFDDVGNMALAREAEVGEFDRTAAAPRAVGAAEQVREKLLPAPPLDSQDAEPAREVIENRQNNGADADDGGEGGM